jgi:Tfp pilus assembly protein PilX
VKASHIRYIPHQRGAATLIVAFGIACALLLTMVFTHRNLVFAQRSSVNQQRSTLSYEAAEAGLNWAQAMLNQPEAANERCEALDPSSATTRKTARTFAQRHSEGTSPVAARCVNTADGWACHCAGGDPEPSGSAIQQTAFSLQIKALAAEASQPARLQISATGCHAAQAPCTARGNASIEEASQVRLQVQLARIGGLRKGLTQAITLRDGAQSAPEFFAEHFGLDPNTWIKQPAVRVVRCEVSSNCLESALKTLSIAIEPTLLWMKGDVVLDASADHTALFPAVLGSDERPVTLVVTGRLTLRGPVQIHGVLYATSVETPGTDPSTATELKPQVHGAVLAENSVSLAADQVLLNADVLNRLQTQTGTYARLPGSWKDF